MNNDLDWIEEIVDDLEKNPENIPVTFKNAKVGMRVVRGKDWNWEDQDKHNVGTVVYMIIDHESMFCDNNWVRVVWDRQDKNISKIYRVGPDFFDLYIKY